MSEFDPGAFVLGARKKQQLQAATRNDAAHGSAKPLSLEEIAQRRLYEGPLLFGRTSHGVLRYGGNGHCLTFAPTGTGKSVSVVVPNLLTYPGSVVCIDPKGAIPSITARQRRAMGQRVLLLDPFEEVERAQRAYAGPHSWGSLPRNSYNPFQSLKRDSPDVIEDTRLLVSSLVVSEAEKHRFFSDSARTVLECLLLFMLAELDRPYWNLPTVLDLAFQETERFEKEYLPAMRASEEFGGQLRRLANQLAGFSAEGGPAIWSTLRRSLNFLQTPRMTAALDNSDVTFSGLKSTPTTVYLVLPARRLETHGTWLRLMLASILNQISDSRQPQYPVLFLLDECAALQRLEILETAVGLMRGYGMKLWLIFQDLPQLRRLYGESWSTFISNSGVRQFFNVNDPDTAQFVSDYIGNETRQIFQESVQHGQGLGGGSYSLLQRPVLTPDEVRRLPPEQEILFYEGLQPAFAQKLSYYDRRANPEFEGQWDRDPYVRF